MGMTVSLYFSTLPPEKNTVIFFLKTCIEGMNSYQLNIAVWKNSNLGSAEMPVVKNHPGIFADSVESLERKKEREEGAVLFS